jgi:RNA polymerase sigma factor (sigma-70 family)
MREASPVEPVGHLLRELAPQVLGALTRRHGDFGEAEDALQEAMIAAALQWPAQGIPNNPRGWLYQVAQRRITDQVRSEMARREREDAVAAEVLSSIPLAPQLEWSLDADRDDTLLLLFMCSHPALTGASAIALTLRAVAGLTTAEIASAFLVPEATMAQRISRAKQSIKASQIPFEMPSAAERADRLASVLHVLYLIFNEGYTSSSGDELQRVDLANEALRLTRAVHALLPGDGEVAGLLALMLLTDARRAARSGPHGELIPLDEQNRSLWNRAQIDEGVALVSEVFREGTPGYYRLQAAVAALHDTAESTETTDWAQIMALYGVLHRMTGNPMVALNRAIAVGMVEGPHRALQLLEELSRDDRISEHYRLDAVRAHMLERAGEHEGALTFYQRAAERTHNIPEKNYLLRKAARLSRFVADRA